MISSQYNWTDERILDLPICRIRQIVKDIEKRLKAERLRQDLVLEWQTRTLAAFISGTVRVEKGSKNPLLEAVKDIKLVQDPGKPKAVEKQPSEEHSLEWIMEHGSPTADNSTGSFERAMQGFGG